MAFVLAAVLIPSAAAKTHDPALKLSLVPLQKAQLGAVGKSLKLGYGSGPKAFTFVGLKAFDVRLVVSDALFIRKGRIARYALDYGDAFTGRKGVTEIRTGVEEYKTPAAAKAGYRLWQRVDSHYQRKNPGRPWKKIKVPAVGPRHFAYLGTWASPGLNPIIVLDEHVRAGRFVLNLTVIAGSAKAAKHAAPRLARRLYHRFQLMLNGHPAGKPVKLPRKPTHGPVASGPDLSTMTVQPSDVGQTDPTSVTHYYRAFRPARSAYVMTMVPAGLYDEEFDQQIDWWPTAKEARYAEAYVCAVYAKFFRNVSPVDLSAVGDGATGFIADNWGGGSVAVVSLTNGRAGEYIVGATTGTGAAPTETDVQDLAQAAADRLDAGLGP